jgi:hypothetical protein
MHALNTSISSFSSAGRKARSIGMRCCKDELYKTAHAFYDWLEQNTLSTSAFALYFALLMANNKSGWTEWFARTNLALCAMIGVSENTLKKARNELKQKGLIDFKPSNKKK